MPTVVQDSRADLIVCVRYLSVAGLFSLGLFLLVDHISDRTWSALLGVFACGMLLYCAIAGRLLSEAACVVGLALVGFLSLAQLSRSPGFSFILHLEHSRPGLHQLLGTVGLFAEAYVVSAALIAISGARPRQGRFGAVGSAVVLFLCAFAAVELIKPDQLVEGFDTSRQTLPALGEILLKSARSICYCALGLVCIFSFLEQDDRHRTWLQLAGVLVWSLLMLCGLGMASPAISGHLIRWLAANGAYFGLYALALVVFLSIRSSPR